MSKILSIIVTYNAKDWLGTCIGSLIRSDLSSDIAIVDNASSDDTVALVNENYLNAIKWFFPLKENLGFGKAHNYVFNEVPLEEYNFIFLLNQDASVEPGTIKQLVDIANQRPNYGVLSPVHYHKIGQQEKGFNRYYTTLNEGVETVGSVSIRQVGFINAAIWLIRRDVVEKLHGFDPLHFHYGEDRTFVHRLRYLGFEVGVVEEAVAYHYRSQEASGLHKKKVYEQMKIMNMITALQPQSRMLPITRKVLFRNARFLVVSCVKLDWKEAWGILGSSFSYLREMPAVIESRRTFLANNNLK